MKRCMTFILILALAFSACGCGVTTKKCTIPDCNERATQDENYGDAYCEAHLYKKKAFDASQTAYNYISEAYAIVSEIGSDIYEAWRLAIYDKDEIVRDGTSYLAKELTLSEEELNDGLTYFIAVMVYEEDWDSLSDSQKASYESNSDLYWYSMKDDLFGYCVYIVIDAYIVAGKIDEAAELLQNAKEVMKTMSDMYSDYEYYPALKGFYTTTAALNDFCNNPEGSFEQFTSTLEGYRNSIRDYRADLDYIFAE